MSGRNDLDDGFERLLRGENPGTPAERELNAFVDDVQEAFPVQSLLAEDVHLARITEAAQLLADKGDPVARPVSNATGRARHASGLPKRRRATVRMPVMKSLAAKVVAGFVVLMSMFGGVAFAGALPGGVQDTVADAVASVVDLPGGEDEAEADEPVEDEAEAEDADDEAEDADDEAEDADDEGEDADDEGEDADDEGEDADDEAEDADDEAEDADDEAEDADDEAEDADDEAEDE